MNFLENRCHRYYGGHVKLDVCAHPFFYAGQPYDADGTWGVYDGQVGVD
jgi:hypothetical protein